jgi:hypothetical protein
MRGLAVSIILEKAAFFLPGFSKPQKSKLSAIDERPSGVLFFVNAA